MFAKKELGLTDDTIDEIEIEDNSLADLSTWAKLITHFDKAFAYCLLPILTKKLILHDYLLEVSGEE